MWEKILLITLMQFRVVYSVYNYNSEGEINTDELISHLSRLINLYTNYDVIFHFDLKSNYLIDKLIAGIDFDAVKSVALINYECNNRKFMRIGSKRVLNVVFLDNSSDFRLYSEKTQNIRKLDVVHYILKNRTVMTDLVETVGLNLFGNVIFISINDTILSTYKVCYFCGEFSGKVVEYNENYFANNTNLLPRNFTNFHEHTFKIAFIEYFPLAWCENIGETISIRSKQYKTCTLVKGTEYQLIGLIAERLNFKIIVIRHEDDYLGAINETGHAVFDIAMGGITVTVQRAELATFTNMYWYESYNSLFFYRKYAQDQLLSCLEPLRAILWISIIAVCLLTAVTFDLLGKFADNDSRISGVNTFWVCLRLLIDQQVPHVTISKLRRRSLFLLTAWCILCLNMNTAYKSKVLSTLLNPAHNEPQRFLELVKEGYTIVTNSNYGDVISAFLKHSEKEHQNSISKLVILDNVCDEFDYAAKHKAAVIDEYTSLQYEVRNTCVKKMEENKGQLRNVRITRSMKMFGHGWALSKGAPFQEAFSKTINRILSVGLILKWRQDATRSMDRNSSFFPYSYMRNNHNEDDGHVSLQTLISPFFIYILGNIIAVIAFIAETMYEKVQKKKSI